MAIPNIKRLEEAIAEALGRSKRRNFKQSVELIVVLRGLNLKDPSSKIRETTFLPNPISKRVKICVVADGETAIKAKEAGADRVLTRTELQELAGDRKSTKKIVEEHDWFLIRTDLMAQAGRILGPLLGPRGKIPVPVPPNVDIASLIEKYRSAVLLRIKNQPQIMCRIGTEDMPAKKLAENAHHILLTLSHRLPEGERNIYRIYVKTTMGPAIEVR